MAGIHVSPENPDVARASLKIFVILRIKQSNLSEQELRIGWSFPKYC
jgi:hypothetical protein